MVELSHLHALACGPTPEDAARAFAEHQWRDCALEIREVEPAESGDPTFRVRGRLYTTPAGWVSIKIDGVAVPGGYVVTEWI
jgi:hypothetical protein